jgi:hypothetical protein
MPVMEGFEFYYEFIPTGFHNLVADRKGLHLLLIYSDLIWLTQVIKNETLKETSFEYGKDMTTFVLTLLPGRNCLSSAIPLIAKQAIGPSTC